MTDNHCVKHSLKLVLLLGISASLCHAQEEEAAKYAPASFESQHRFSAANGGFEYTATASETLLRDTSGTETASIWSTSYVKSERRNEVRPVTFVFNGGPGSASAWLHIGLLGPKVVRVPSRADRDDGAPPYPLVDNDQSVFGETDLVFVDSIGTGYSRPIGALTNEDFWSLKGDTSSMTAFIREWVTANQRWNSPKYILGLSFGTTRAAAVSRALLDGGQDMALNGLILISQALDFTGSTSQPSNLLGYVTYLPSMAATAHYHGKAGRDTSLTDFVEEARVFAVNDYLPALIAGTMLSDVEEQRIATELARLTGLDRNYILAANLRVLASRFRKQLLREDGLVLGANDGRYLGDESDNLAAGPTLGDAGNYAISSAHTAAFNHYQSTTLGVTMSRPYLMTNSAISQNWVWRTAPKGSFWEPSFVNVVKDLSESMRMNSEMRIMVANGYYDLITPFLDAELTFARHEIVQDRVTMRYYEGGHRMYLNDGARAKLIADIRLFYAK
jgi:carboxypeptidase C (cathepsin A)